MCAYSYLWEDVSINQSVFIWVALHHIQKDFLITLAQIEKLEKEKEKKTTTYTILNTSFDFNLSACLAKVLIDKSELLTWWIIICR